MKKGGKQKDSSRNVSSEILSSHLNSVYKKPGPGCSKLTTSLVNETFTFQTSISQIRQYVLLKKCDFSTKKIQCIWL